MPTLLLALTARGKCQKKAGLQQDKARNWREGRIVGSFEKAVPVIF
jgi:hypothetical protein